MPVFFLHACEYSCIPVMPSVINYVISSCSQERKASLEKELLVSSILHGEQCTYDSNRIV